MPEEIQATKAHCAYCFSALHKACGKAPVYTPDVPGTGKEAPVFVSWYIRPQPEKDHQLRGCIGTFSPQVLPDGLKEYAIRAGMHDPRFHPIQAAELPQLECSVSYLTPMEPCRHWEDWDIGVHGIYIHLKNPVQDHTHGHTMPKVLTATFLPEVAPAQGWSKKETIDHAIQKAGWRGSIDDTMRTSLEVSRYRSHQATLTYQEYIAQAGL
ncbi:hypothetical protein ACI68E_003770 [Malassezia pachydermatis]|uniref:AMMECR1 domain-containing protein n=1 Tax=Malassezia pachydermatis TaxID=77020 RepID=A0A0M8MTI1_9BASI|nr:hypothetical protein Malapachy_0193 [Malassezia pachydermatis]KOS13470.1 hypothetical protein Malapachy_0193 [Malassezia pachydermatis]